MITNDHKVYSFTTYVCSLFFSLLLCWEAIGIRTISTVISEQCYCHLIYRVITPCVRWTQMELWFAVQRSSKGVLTLRQLTHDIHRSFCPTKSVWITAIWSVFGKLSMIGWPKSQPLLNSCWSFIFLLHFERKKTKELTVVLAHIWKIRWSLNF